MTTKALELFRQAACDGDLNSMASLLKDSKLAAQENPEGLPLELLAATIQFHMALLEGDNKQVRELLQAKPELVGQRWTQQGFTPLSQTIVKNRPDLFELLIKAGADPFETFDGGATLLHTVAYNGSLQLAKRLVKLGLAKRSPDDAGHLPIEIAKQSGHRELVRFLS